MEEMLPLIKATFHLSPRTHTERGEIRCGRRKLWQDLFRFNSYQSEDLHQYGALCKCQSLQTISSHFSSATTARAKAPKLPSPKIDQQHYDQLPPFSRFAIIYADQSDLA